MKGKNKGKKFIFSGAFVVCMAFAILFTVFGTKASGETTGVVYEPCTKENTVPTKGGFLFGGWYQAGNDGEPVTNPEQGKTYYAKFVPENVLGIKAQVSNTILADSTEKTAAIRFVTTIDSVQYRKIGFLIQKGTGEVKEANVTNTVYESLYQVTDQDGTLGNTPEEVSPAIFDAASKYFKTYTIRKVPDSAYNTDITVTPYWITLDGTKVMGTKSIKTVNLGRSWVYVAASANADGEGYGTYAHPFTNLTDAFNGIRLENGGKVTVKGNSMVEVPVDFNWTKHTVAVKDQVKDCNIMITGETTEAGIDFSAAKELHVRDNVIFDGMTLKFYGKSLDDYGEVYANGNQFTINTGVTSDNKFTTIFGGSKNADVTGDTNVELYSGRYKAVFGGGYTGGVDGSTHVTVENVNIYTPQGEYDSNKTEKNRVVGGSYNGGTITGDTHVTVGNNFNATANLNDKGTVSHSELSAIFGGSYGIKKADEAAPAKGIVKGSTYITLQDNAKTNYIYGGGDQYSSVEGTCNVTMSENSSAMSIWGGAYRGENKDTSIIMNGGRVEQIFGGNQNGMTGNTYIEIGKGAVITRRVYGGCYNSYNKSTGNWAATMHYVNGYTTVAVKDSEALQFVGDLLGSEDNGFCAGSRCNANSEQEVGVFIFTDNIYGDVSNKIGYKGLLQSETNAVAYNYLIDATTGGTVKAGGKLLQIVPTSASAKGTVAFKDDENVQVYFNAECSWPMVNVGATTQKNVKVDFAAAAMADTSAFEASMDEIYYAQLEDAIDAANVRTAQPVVEVLKDANVERVMYAEKGADFTVQSSNSVKTITGGTNDAGEAFNLLHVLADGKLTVKDLKLVNGYNAIASAGMVTVTNVESEGAGNAGLTVSGEAKATGLTITNAAGNGVYVASGATADITELTVTGTGKTAIRPAISATIKVTGGTVTTTAAGAYGIYLDGTCGGTIQDVDITTTEANAINTRGTSKLTLMGGTIKTDNAEVICTLANSELTLDGTTIERTSSNNKALVSVREQSIVTMNGTSRIDGKKAFFTGRGVEVQGTFNLEGGTIIDSKGAGETSLVINDNVASGANFTDGCGVYVINGGTFTMSGGTIEGNETTSGGAAVAVNGDGATFTLENNGTIQNNTASFGAVMARNGEFNMTGGTITANTATTSGGGVVVSKGTFTMSGGTISGNKARSGGGVFMNSTGKIILSDAGTGIITKNEATSTSGGGIYITNGTLEISGGKISYNTAATYGGAIAITSGNLEISGGTISNNTATKNAGGAVDVNGKNATFTLTGGTISDNYGEGGGGGVCLRACAEANMSGGTIKANRTNESNTAGNGGGILMATGVVFTMTGGEIRGNHGRNGGAIYLNPNDLATAKIRFGGGVISGNTSFNANRGGVGTGSASQATIIYINGKSADDIADKTFNLKLGTE